MHFFRADIYAVCDPLTFPLMHCTELVEYFGFSPNYFKDNYIPFLSLCFLEVASLDLCDNQYQMH